MEPPWRACPAEAGVRGVCVWLALEVRCGLGDAVAGSAFPTVAEGGVGRRGAGRGKREEAARAAAGSPSPARAGSGRRGPGAVCRRHAPGLGARRHCSHTEFTVKQKRSHTSLRSLRQGQRRPADCSASSGDSRPFRTSVTERLTLSAAPSRELLRAAGDAEQSLAGPRRVPGGGCRRVRAPLPGKRGHRSVWRVGKPPEAASRFGSPKFPENP